MACSFTSSKIEGSYVGAANSYLGQLQPIVLVLAIPAAQIAIRVIGSIYQQGVRQTFSNLLGRVAFSIPAVRNTYDKKLSYQLKEFQASILKKWEAMGKPITALPEEGMSFDALCNLIAHYRSITREKIKDQQLSGAIYSNSLTPHEQQLLTPEMLIQMPIPENSTEKIAVELKQLFLLAFQDSYLWNTLHGEEFAIGQFINYQLIQIMGNQFGGKTDEIAGFVTSGGTESLMTAAKAYIKWGVQERGLSEEQCVIIAPQSIHAALKKAQIDHRFQLIELPTDEIGQISLIDLKQIENRYGKRIVALFGSAPSYPMGKVDPIKEMGTTANRLGCGMHVDCCLGGLVIEMLSSKDATYLSFPGVTSLSVDPHKNGMTPKGCSVLVTQQMSTGKNLAFYPIYAIPDWSGGIYGTPTTAGSQSSVPAFTALLALLKMGKSGYRQMAKLIHLKAVELGSVIQNCQGLKLLGDVEVNVIAFKIDETMSYEKGAIYGFTHLMKKRGFSCSNLAEEAAHFCVTGRFVGKEGVIEAFKRAAEESLEELAKLNSKKKLEGIEFPGEASLYGEIGAALYPRKEEMKTSKYIENYFFGQRGAEDAIRSYFLAGANPHLRT